MIKDIKELNFPAYATLESATVTNADMGEWNIVSQVKIDGQITPDFSFDWEVNHRGHKYIMPLREPQASVENTSLDSTIDLTFQHWAQYQLKRWYFFTVQPVESGTAVPDKYIASVSLTLPNFIILFGQVLAYYYGDKIKIQLNPAWVSKDEPTTVEINHSYIWDVLLKLYELYAVRWTIEADADNEGCYIIKIGYGAEEISHVFEYGLEGGLLKVERQVQNENIRNMLIGRGGEKNLPYRYYKDVDIHNDSFPADPDWIPELANIHFDVLRGVTFRSYIQGWKAKHYNGKTTKANAYAPWAWEKGYTDEKFNPIEYVKDDESIAKYGPLMGGFDNNEDFHPTIQGVNSGDHLNFFGKDFGRVDQTVAVEKITKDESEIVKPNDSTTATLGKLSQTVSLNANERKTITIQGDSFTIPTGKKGDLFVSIKALTHANIVIPSNEAIEVYAVGSNTPITASGISEGVYTFKCVLELHNTSANSVYVTVGDNSPKLITATPDEELNGTFNIWIKNIWGTAKTSTETNKEYVERVWLPILGGSDGSEAKIVFSNGWLSTSEDYEFMIVKGGINYDTTKTLTKDGKTSQSHWRLTLARCDAEYEATGKYIPNNEHNANDGDYFFFTGIDMPNAYTVWAEERLDNWKKDQLLKVANIQPTRVVQTDRVRMNNYGNPGALIDQIRPGCSVTLRDEKFIPGSHEETLYIQSVTYTYRKPSSDDNALNPDVEMTLGKEYAVSGNVVEQLQGDIEVLHRQIGSISNVAEIVESIANKKYIRKDRNDKTPYSLGIGGALDVNERIDLGQFLAGVSGARLGIDKADGKTFLEVDNIFARVRAYFEQLTIINADTVAGRQYITPGGSVRCTMVEETAAAYRCYFLSEQDGEKTETYIKTGDQAIAEMFNAKTGTTNKVSNHRWWRLVTDVQQSAYIDDSGNTYGYIEVSKSDCESNSDIPQEGDVICQFGSRNDTTRQAAMLFDTVGSGAPSVTLLTGIGSGTTNAEHYSLKDKDIVSYGYDRTKGNAYFNVYGDTYIGDRNGSTFIKYDQETKQLDIRAKISASSTIDGKSLEQYIQGVVPPVKQEDIEGFVSNIMGDTIDGFDKSITDINKELGSIQNQIDGVIETWFHNGVPELTNYPASEWGSYAEKLRHLGDLYYDNDTGTAYRFSTDAEEKTFYWYVITDSAITKALAEARDAKDLADRKRRVFVARPAKDNAYDEGDIWVNAYYSDATHRYENDILRCVTAKKSGDDFNIAHWTLASKYTDDTALNTFIQGYEQTIADIQEQVDGKAETWYQANDPSTAWNTTALKAAHVGDLWYCTQNDTAKGYEKDHAYYWDGTKWVESNAPQSVFDAIDGKADIFVSKPTGGYKANDLWFLEADYSLSGISYKSGTLVVAKKDMGAAWSATDWMKKDRYTDDTAVAALDDKYKYLKPALEEDSVTEGGLLLTTLIKLGIHNAAGVQGQIVGAGINGAYHTDLLGNGIGSWWGGDMIDLFNADGTVKTGDAAKNAATALVRMDGSAYFAKGNIGFNADGSGWFGTGTNKIEFKNGVMTFGAGITINVKDEAGIQQTLQTVLNQMFAFGTALTPMYKSPTGYQPTTWGEISKGTKTLAAIKTAVGFYSESFISAMGANGSEGNGSAGGGLIQSVYGYNDLTKTFNDSIRTDTFNAFTIKTIADRVSAIENAGMDTAALASYLTGNGYAKTTEIQDWVTDKGYITASALTPYLEKTEAEGKYVDLTGAQFINGLKTFGDSKFRTLGGGPYIGVFDSVNASIPTEDIDSEWKWYHGYSGIQRGLNIYSYNRLPYSQGWAGQCVARFEGYGAIKFVVNGRITGDSISKKGGTSTQFLKADGSVDTTAYASKTDFDDLKAWAESMFAKEPDGKGGFRIKAKYGLYTNQYLSALGAGDTAGSGSTGGVSVNLLQEWNQYTADAAMRSWALSAYLGHDLQERVTAIEHLYLNRYEAQNLYQPAGDYLTQHQSLHTLTLQKNGATAGTYNPSAANTIDITDVASAATLSALNTSYEAHTHGLVNKGLGVTVDTTNAELNFANLGDNTVGYLIKAVRSNGGYATPWLVGNYASGLIFGGSDTRSVLSMSVYKPHIKFAAGDFATGKPRWYMSIEGTAAATYNLDNLLVTDGSNGTAAGVSALLNKLGIGGSDPMDADYYISQYAGGGTTTTTYHRRPMSALWGYINGKAANVYAKRSDTVLDRGGDYEGNIYEIPVKSVFSGLDVADAPVKGWVSGLALGSNWNNSHFQHYLVESGNRWYTTREYKEGRMVNWKTFAYLDDKVAGAETADEAIMLRTTHKIWGQDYNGTQDVTGSIVGASNITASGRIATSGGNIGAGITNPTYRLHVIGVAYASDGMFSDGYVSALGTSSSSDERLKEILSEVSLSVSDIADAPSVRFAWKSTRKEDIGSIAQYWRNVLPHSVRTAHNGYLSLDYGKAALLSAIAVARQTISHERRIEALERENRELQTEINELRRNIHQ